MKKGEEGRFEHGIDGAYLACPFQCDFCWFYNLYHREPSRTSFADRRNLAFIRRANLDIMWSRAPSTISGLRVSYNRILKCWEELGLTPDLPTLGPWPTTDVQGFKLALAHLSYSLEAGKNQDTHTQYDTIRKLRTFYNHMHEVSPDSVLHKETSFRSQKGDIFLLSDCPTQTRLFTMFMRGMLLRMGRQTEVNWGLDCRVLHVILFNLEEEIKKRTLLRRFYIMLGAYLLVGFVLALRGNEIGLVEAGGLITHLNYGLEDGKDAHVVVPLLGRFKNEDGEMYHLMFSVSVTASGFEVRKWVTWVVQILRTEHKTSGPAFCHLDGTPLESSTMNDEFLNQLELVQESRPDLIPPQVDVRKHYSLYRSPRRGATARATDQDVGETTINLHNRWRTMENMRGERSRIAMHDYYTDLRLTLNKRLLFTRSL